MDARNLHEALAQLDSHWQPHRLATVNDHDIKVVKVKGEFIWHTHPDTDELFLVIRGALTIQFRDRDTVLGPGDVVVVPRGVEHCPVAEDEAEIVLIEMVGTVNTGDAGGERTSVLKELS
jgi:mannose-6-phosphate isomerase-like protein (cupin superfamily)